MRLWLRRLSPAGGALRFDEELAVHSQAEWRERINRPGLVSSILWPEPPLFSLAGPDYLGRRHPHERNYRHDPVRNLTYREGCRRLAARLRPLIRGKKCLAYIPLRGALPIWRGIEPFLSGCEVQTYHAVTSSFVFYPEPFRILNKKGRPASGRYTNVLELSGRIKPVLREYDFLVYVDEIVSGGMMKGYLQDMLDMGLDSLAPIIAVGLADGFGERSLAKRRLIERLRQQGRIHNFLWEGCPSLITEDNRWLLGMHYVDYRLGPHAVPLLVGADVPLPPAEKTAFDRDLLGKG